MTLSALAAAMLPADTELADAVRLAETSPAEYVRQHAPALRQRGIREPVRDLPLYALIDGLIAAGAAQEIDWREDPYAIGDVVESFRILPGGIERVRDVLLLDPDLHGCDTAAAIAKIAALLAPAAVRLVTIDIGTDSYPLVCIQTSRLDELLRAASVAGLVLRPV